MSKPDTLARVNFATAEPTTEGTSLHLRTQAGLDVEFLLDDLAFAMLAMTLRSVVSDALLRKERGEKPRFFMPEEATRISDDLGEQS